MIGKLSLWNKNRVQAYLVFIKIATDSKLEFTKVRGWPKGCWWFMKDFHACQQILRFLNQINHVRFDIARIVFVIFKYPDAVLDFAHVFCNEKHCAGNRNSAHFCGIGGLLFADIQSLDIHFSKQGAFAVKRLFIKLERLSGGLAAFPLSDPDLHLSMLQNSSPLGRHLLCPQNCSIHQESLESLCNRCCEGTIRCGHASERDYSEMVMMRTLAAYIFIVLVTAAWTQFPGPSKGNLADCKKSEQENPIV